MKKLLTILVSVLLMTGCSSVPSSNTPTDSDSNTQAFTTDLKILSPSGAPALALLNLFEDNSDQITVVEGADVLQASFVSPEHEYDVIIAPTNLGVKLALSGKTDYRLAAVVTWGNLYVLAENEESLKNDAVRFAAFGEQAVPGLVFESVKDQLHLDDVTYYSAVTEAQAALLSKNADAALIAEPAATATIAKAKEKEMSLQVVADIQSLWESKTGSKGYPQASIFVLDTDENTQKINDLLTEIEASMNKFHSEVSNGSTDHLIASIDVAGAETLGVPNAQIVAKSYLKMGLGYRAASSCEQELSDFLSLFGISYDSKIAVR